MLLYYLLNITFDSQISGIFGWLELSYHNCSLVFTSLSSLVSIHSRVWTNTHRLEYQVSLLANSNLPAGYQQVVELNHDTWII